MIHAPRALHIMTMHELTLYPNSWLPSMRSLIVSSDRVLTRQGMRLAGLTLHEILPPCAFITQLYWNLVFCILAIVLQISALLLWAVSGSLTVTTRGSWVSCFTSNSNSVLFRTDAGSYILTASGPPDVKPCQFELNIIWQSPVPKDPDTVKMPKYMFIVLSVLRILSVHFPRYVIGYSNQDLASLISFIYSFQ